MSTTTEAELTKELDERRKATRELEGRAEQARVLGKAVADMQGDVLRLEKRQKAFAALGDDHLETPQAVYDQRVGATIEMEPLRSKLTGRELAAGVQVDIDYLKGESAKAEQEIKRLLART